MMPALSRVRCQLMKQEALADRRAFASTESAEPFLGFRYAVSTEGLAPER
jgi:hypothetical protein